MYNCAVGGVQFPPTALFNKTRRGCSTSNGRGVQLGRYIQYTFPASAGTGNILDSDLAEELLVPESTEAEQADFVISVSGNSMEPTYHNGDKVFVEKCDSVDIGEVGIFILNGESYIKERGNNKLISHNEKYKPIPLTENDSVYCCGRVIGIVE